MRLALKYPSVYSAVTASGDTYDWTPELNTVLVAALKNIHELPKDSIEVSGAHRLIGWYIQVAAGAASNPENPPFYFDLPFRIVNGQGEIVPEVAAKIVELDSAHEAQRYIKQSLRLRGNLIQPAIHDSLRPIELVRSFDQLLTKLGIEHEYVEVDSGQCSFPWESSSLKFLSAHLVFEEP